MYTKGEIAGGWIHVSHGVTPIALVHPKYVDRFITIPEMCKLLHRIIHQQGWLYQKDIDDYKQILAKAKGGK